MKLEELSKEELILLIKNLYHKCRFAQIDLFSFELNMNPSEKERLFKEYTSDILRDGIDEIILRSVGRDFD
jgi:hypothetical protein